MSVIKVYVSGNTLFVGGKTFPINSGVTASASRETGSDLDGVVFDTDYVIIKSGEDEALVSAPYDEIYKANGSTTWGADRDTVISNLGALFLDTNPDNYGDADDVADNTSEITAVKGRVTTTESDITNIEKAVKIDKTSNDRGVYYDDAKSKTNSLLSVGDGTATIQGGAGTAITITEASPGSQSFSVAAGPEGSEVAFEAVKLEGKTALNSAALNLQAGTKLGFGDTTYSSTLGTTALTAARSIELPDASGTVALTSDIPSFVGYVDTTGTPANNQVAVFTDQDTIEGSTALIVDGANVGIGTASPSYPLEVLGNAKLSGNVGINVNPGTYPTLRIRPQSGNDARVIIGTNQGNTGQHILGFAHHLQDTSVATGIISETTTANGDGRMYLCVRDGSDGSTITTSDSIISLTATSVSLNRSLQYNDNTLRIGLNNSGDVYFRFRPESKVAVASKYLGSYNRGDFRVLTYPNADGTVVNIDDHTRLIVDPNGNVGIGTDTPSEALDVVGKANINDGNNNVLISTGNSTITASNTTAVGYQALTALTTGNVNTAIGYQSGYNTTTGGGNTLLGYSSGYNITTGNNNTAVGVNTLFQAANNTAGATAIGRQAGRRGVQDGGVSVGYHAGFYGAENSVFIGYSAGEGTTETGRVAGQVGIGYQALTALTTGTGNTAVGYQAGDSVLAGVDNTFLGYGTDLVNGNNSYNTLIGSGAYVSSNGNRMTAVGYSARAGGSSTSIGAQAGSNNSGQSVAMGYQAGNGAGNWNTSIGNSAHTLSTGNYNTSIGGGANRFTSGDNNVAVGNAAAYGVQNTSTFSNTVAVGYQALNVLTTGAGNTAVGYQSLASATSNQRNTAVGSHTLKSATSGNDNTALGFQSLIAVTSGNYNTALGFAAGDSLTTGNNNTLVGHAAGSQLLNHSGNVMIGYNAGYNETGSNKLYIENSDSTSPLIYGEFDNDIVRVNGELQVGDPAATGFKLPTLDGNEAQILSTDGAGNVSWIDGYNLQEQVKNVSGSTLYRGTPVHVTGSTGQQSDVVAANATTNYPAHYILDEDLAANESGRAILIGAIQDVDLTPFGDSASNYSEADTVYLGASGGFTTTKPSFPNKLQQLGVILKVNTAGNQISGMITGMGQESSLLGDLNDVTITNPATGQLISYNAALGWYNVDSLTNLQSVSTNSLTVTGAATINAPLAVSSLTLTGAGEGTFSVGAVTSDLAILSSGNVRVLLDNDNNETGQSFTIQDPSNTVRFEVTDTGAATFNDAFTLPTADGTTGQVLATDGAGVVGWADAGGGGKSSSASGYLEIKSDSITHLFVGPTNGIFAADFTTGNNDQVSYSHNGTAPTAGTTTINQFPYYTRSGLLDVHHDISTISFNARMRDVSQNAADCEYFACIWHLAGGAAETFTSQTWTAVAVGTSTFGSSSTNITLSKVVATASGLSISAGDSLWITFGWVDQPSSTPDIPVNWSINLNE